MNRIDLRRLGGVMFVAGALVAGLFAAGAVSAKAPSAVRVTSVARGAIHMRFNLQRFQLDPKHRRLVARGNVVATYRSDGRVVAVTTQRTTLAVKQATTSCRVLHLELGELRLQLLGLIVSLTPTTDPSIVLDISANSNEALGKLFCQVLNAVQGGTTSAAATATRRLSAAVAGRYRSGVMTLDVPLRTQQTAAATTTAGTTTAAGAAVTPGQCEVLDLVLGPLNLDLLGLVVQLNQVELNVSANPVGTLGTLFCQLAGSTTTSTTATTTAGTTTG
jgi:hypothetical protein